MKKHKVYVYGTLRPFTGETVEISGEMYDLGWFPGVKLGGSYKFKAEVIEVDNQELKRLDEYEGYDSRFPENSLYIRKEYEDGWIYEFNGSVTDRKRIESGDWKAYKEGNKCT